MIVVSVPGVSLWKFVERGRGFMGRGTFVGLTSSEVF